MAGGSISKASYSTHTPYSTLKKKRILMNQSSRDIRRSETFKYYIRYGETW